MFKLIFRLSILALFAAYFTLPSENTVNLRLEERLQQAIQEGDLTDIQDPAQILLLAACKANSSACSQLARSAIQVTYERKYLFAFVGLEGLGQKAQCYAAYTRLFCPGGFVGN